MNIDERINRLSEELRDMGKIATDEKLSYSKWHRIRGLFMVLNRNASVRLEDPTVGFDISKIEIYAERMEEKIKYLISIGRNGLAFGYYGIYLGTMQKYKRIHQQG